MISGIYQIKNTINNKFYIGSAKNLNVRKARHFSSLKNCRHENIYLQRSYNKHGECFFVFNIMEYCEEKYLLEREQYYLDLLKPFYPNGYNIGINSSGGDNLTLNPNRKNIIEKIKNTVTKKIKSMTKDERVAKWGMFGENNPNFGNKWSNESRKKLSVFQKELWKNNSYKNMMIEKFKGKTKTYFNRDISGKNNPFFGKKHTKETIKILSEKGRDRFLKATPEERYLKNKQIKKVYAEGNIYFGLSEAARSYNISPSTMLFRVNSKTERFKEFYYL